MRVTYIATNSNTPVTDILAIQHAIVFYYSGNSLSLPKVLGVAINNSVESHPACDIAGRVCTRPCVGYRGAAPQSRSRRLWFEGSTLETGRPQPFGYHSPTPRPARLPAVSSSLGSRVLVARRCLRIRVAQHTDHAPVGVAVALLQSVTLFFGGGAAETLNSGAQTPVFADELGRVVGRLRSAHRNCDLHTDLLVRSSLHNNICHRKYFVLV